MMWIHHLNIGCKLIDLPVTMVIKTQTFNDGNLAILRRFALVHPVSFGMPMI